MSTENVDSPTLRAKIGEQIAKLRRDRHWTLTELARQSGLDQGGLSKMERGLKPIHDQHLEALAQAFDVHPADLLPGALRPDDRALIDAVQAGDPNKALHALANALDTTVADLAGGPPVLPNGVIDTDELADLGQASAAMTRASASMTRHLARIVAAGEDPEAIVERWMRSGDDGD